MQLENSRVASGDMARYVGKCPESDLPDADKAAAMISRHLHDRGFEF
jgi:hypothetical protein